MAMAVVHWLITLILIVAIGTLSVVLFAFVHQGLQRLYIIHAYRFCRKSGLTPVRCRVGAAFDASGIKTESAIVELDCRDGFDRLKLVRLSVWAFGVRKVLEIEELSAPLPADSGTS